MAKTIENVCNKTKTIRNCIVFFLATPCQEAALGRKPVVNSRRKRLR